MGKLGKIPAKAKLSGKIPAKAFSGHATTQKANSERHGMVLEQG